MTALKAHEVERFLNAPDLKSVFFLSYGPDQGLVRETAQRLIKAFGSEGGDDDPFSQITFDADELNQAPEKLAIEARTTSMFGGKRRIRVCNGGKSLVATLEELLAEPPDAAIIVEAGNLTPKDALRALAEKHKLAYALPCYADREQTIATLITQTFNQHNISADSDAIATLRDLLGNDREITRHELEKLCLFAAESKTISRADVLTLCADNAAMVLDEVVDAAGIGRADKLDAALARAATNGVDTQRILITALMHFSNLRRMRAEVESGKRAQDVLESQRPKPHFSRKSLIEQQLRLWSEDALASATARLYEAIAQSRKQSELGSAIVHRALLAVSVAAAHR